MNIKAYRKVQTGPNSQEGGAQDGLMSVEYQLYEFISLYFFIINNILNFYQTIIFTQPLFFGE